MSEEWDGFTSEVEAYSVNKGPGCGVGTLLQSLPGEAAESIEAAINRPELTASAINAALRRRGAEISIFTLRRHRRRECSCRTNGQ